MLPKIVIIFFVLSASPVMAQQNTVQDTTKADTLHALQTSTSQGQGIQKPRVDWDRRMPWIIALAVLLFSVFTYLTGKRRERRFERERLKERVRYEQEIKSLKIEMARQKAIAEDEGHQQHQDAESQETARTAEQILNDALVSELGSIRLLGSPDIQNIPVRLLQSFVNLRISESWHSEEAFQHPGRMMSGELSDRDFSPDEIIKRAFLHMRMLLIIGDPGSGKTTLLKYYAMNCLQNNARKLGLTENIIVLYLPLRDLDMSQTLSENLAAWAKKHECAITEKIFYRWLHEQNTLVLFDGLDEISDVQKRKEACDWIDGKANGLKKASFIVTSRWTGYSKLDGVQIGFDHLRADIKEFNWEQQQKFLFKWFRAVANVEPPSQDAPPAWREQRIKEGEHRAQELVDYLARDENKAVRKLADSPLLLQIIAILGRERAFHANDRTELFRAALHYLLDFRDRKRHLDPKLPAKQAVRVLAPTALWMQQDIGRDDVSRAKMHDYMQPLIRPEKENLSAREFCKNLCDRAGIIAELGDEDYIFRHKSFREYLAGLHSVKKANEAEFLTQLASHLGDDWWEEPLRFFMGEADADLFDDFMKALFHSPATEDLEDNQGAQNLLEHLVTDAPAKKTHALVKRLHDASANENQKRYILNCLNAMATEEAKNVIRAFAQTGAGAAAAHAGDLAAQFEEPKIAAISQQKIEIFKSLPPSFRNPFEENAEYIRIPGGSFQFTVKKQKVSVPDIYFAKHLVTNKRYNRFIAYLRGKAGELNELLPTNAFADEMLRFAAHVKGYKEYLTGDPKQWPGTLAAKEDRKKFLGDDQPVVRVSWYAAMAYGLWLTLLRAASEKGGPATLDDAKIHYRLPHEKEWEWAAFGNADGSLRPYPWPEEKGAELTPKLANYGGNVGATTPVGRYPDGATPHGLMDMAGNVWEWQANPDKQDRAARALRGGSWYLNDDVLRCPARGDFNPDFNWNNIIGFRVVLAESKALDTLNL
ncbi:MAG: SUMF1/EgtB/PvdO family nonheme iron enzyme [Actinobacteria bacterium]|nr:SUMF1/EgtB/PvdO family nonheme iron enzyme [Actinomycetota bacterium]